jgi:uncharacterized membrane protein YqaE (UPF0057 family)
MKRRYNKGFYVSVKKKSTSPSTRIEKANDAVASDNATEKTTVASVPVAPAQTSKAPATTAPNTGLRQTVAKKSPAQQQTSGTLVADNSEKTAFVTIADKIKELKRVGLIAQKNGHSDGDVKLVLLVILAIFVPPLAVYLKNEKIDQWFWITLILWLLSVLFFFGRYFGFFWLIAVIIALLYIFDVIH